MKNEADNLPEPLWRQRLSGAEREMLRSQPGRELEARLTEALAKIPNAPVPSNFATRVLAEIEREERPAMGRQIWALHWRQLWPRVAVAAAVMVFAGVSIQRFETNSHRAALARNVAAVAAGQPLPSVEALENLDAIQRMGQSAPADTELLAALQ